MLTSRSDIITDRILDSKDPRRFMKVPISRYLDLLGVTAVDPQIAIINAINNPKYRFITAALSRRVGKTYIANIIGQVTALVPNSNILIMSPNYGLSQISFELQRQLIKHFDLEVARDNAKDKVVELTNGSAIRMGSVNQVDSVVGRSYKLIIFDEAALTDAGEDAFNIALRPTLDAEDSKAIFISTPRGKNNWFSNFYNRGFTDEYKSWASIHATYHDNPRVSQEDIEEAKRSMSKAEFEQEYLASFNTYEGQIWDLSEECIIEPFDVSSCDMIMGLDVGFRDATAAVFVAYSFDTEEYYVVDEYEDVERTTEQHALILKEKMDYWGVDFAFIDSAAQQTKYDLAMNYDISCTNAKKSILDGIGHLGSLFDNGKIKVFSNCKNTLKAIDQYQWDPRPGLVKEKPLHNSASHIADSLRYAIYSFTTSAGVY